MAGYKVISKVMQMSLVADDSFPRSHIVTVSSPVITFIIEDASGRKTGISA